MDQTWWRSADEIDDEQRALIEIDTSEGHYLVTGPPGSGKTNVMLLRASYLRSAGMGNCLVLVFTRMLREFIVAGSRTPAMLPPPRIQTHAGWTKRILRELDRPYEQSAKDLSHDAARAERHSALEAAITSAQLGGNYYDSILVDEVQDYWAEELELLACLTPRLFAVGDSRQRIYSRNEGMQTARNLGCVERPLRMHYRMGPRICRAADRLMQGAGPTESLEQYCQYDDRELPSRVSVHTMPDFQSELELLRDNLVGQLRAYPNEWLGVIASRRTTRDAVAQFLQTTELGSQVLVQSDDEPTRAFDVNRRIVVSTLHSAKGTEYRSVHMLASDDFPHYTREKAYTAVTRAKTTLDVYHTGPLDGAFEAALAPSSVPNLDRIFE